jgi:signal recognition particle receptor subunit beta
MPHEYKVLLVGTMGAGKTTAIAAVSDAPPISTDVDNTARHDFDKATTTVAMDYGEVSLATGDRLRLYGTPGQERFAFMWQILARGALGLVFLVDNSRPDPCADLRTFLDAFGPTLRDATAVVGIGRTERHPTPPLDAYHALVAERGLSLPVFAVDVRKRGDVLLLLDVLFHQIEASLQLDAEATR